MILKKPYAFLIKHFRLIHLVLTILTVLIAVESYRLVAFFNDFCKNNYSATVMENMASEYISGLLYVGIVLVIILLIILAILLSSKKKPIKAYIFSIIYYFIFIIFIVIAGVLIGGLERELWSTASARIYRDVSQLVYYPQLIIIFILAYRAIGFNIKKFNFKDDLREMEITDADSEEIEFNLNFDGSKIKRKARRFIRETGYYYQENKFIITIIAILGTILIGYTIYNNYEKTIFRYKEGNTFGYGGLSLKVLNTMITNVDLKGNVIKDDKVYVVALVEVANNSLKDVEFNYDYLKLYYSNKYGQPDLSFSNYFLDYGVPLTSTIIKTKTKHSYIIPYEIDAEYIDSNFTLGVYLGNSRKKKRFVAKKAIIEINPIKYMDNNLVKSAKLGNEISFGSSTMKNTTLKLDNLELTTRYLYTYEACYGENCQTVTDIIIADSTYLNRSALLIMDYELNVDNTIASFEKIHNISAFAEAFFKIEYGNSEDALRVTTVDYVTPAKLKGKIALRTEGNIFNANIINLIVSIRNKSYKIALK